MLKKRIITALILIPLFVILLLKSSAPAFCIATGLIVLWCAWEWSLLLGITRFPHCFIYPIFILMLLISTLYIPISSLLTIAAAWWLIALLLVIIYPKGATIWGKSIFLRAIMGVLVLIPCWLAICFIRASENGSYILLFLFALIWGADSAAYFVGRQWGKHKLIPQVSPGKSWEGLFGAIIMTVLMTLGVLVCFHLPHAKWPWAMLLAVITVLFSIVGDLFESMLKRNVGLKDSGHLLPGHGGILDRIDSLTAAAPIFAVGAMWLGQM